MYATVHIWTMRLLTNFGGSNHGIDAVMWRDIDAAKLVSTWKYWRFHDCFP